VDPALWLLAKLRFRGWLRRLGRNVRTVKGALLAGVGVLLFFGCVFSWLVSQFMLPDYPDAGRRLEQIRQSGPLALLALCVLHLLSSSAEKAVIPFTPAEVDFLFAGPFSRRQLLAYKLIVRFFSTLASAAFCLLGFGYLQIRSVPASARYLGLVLALAFVQLFTIVLGFLASAIGVRAYNRVRKLILVLIVAAVVVAVLQGGDAFGDDPGGTMERLQQLPAIQVVLEPVRWFVLAFTAERLWPDFVQWALLGLAVNIALVLLVFALDANYLEGAAAASERLYAQLQRARTGGAAAVMLNAGGKTGFSLPSLPRWGGVGPVAWRQLVAVPRSQVSVLLLILVGPLLLLPLLPGFRSALNNRPEVAIVLASQILFLTIFLSFLVTFDFRGDVDRIDVLKALPIAPVALVIGQLVTPVLIVSCIQGLGLGICAATTGRAAIRHSFVVAIPFVVPFNFLQFGLDNFLFLLFPARTRGAPAGDFQALGRQFVVSLAKMIVLGMATGTAALAALPIYWLAGQRLAPALVTAWLVLAGFAAGMVPLLTVAFRRFDVAHDTPP
jgi:hypothetical protein